MLKKALSSRITKYAGNQYHAAESFLKAESRSAKSRNSPPSIEIHDSLPSLQQAATRYPETGNTSLRPKVKGEERQSQASFVLHYYTTLMRNMFRPKYKKPSSREITVQSNHVNHIKSLLVS